MTMRCDHCRGKFGLVVHRYWRMRFCCTACAHAYRQRLHGETRAKIRRLNGGRPMARNQADHSTPVSALPADSVAAQRGVRLPMHEGLSSIIMTPW